MVKDSKFDSFIDEFIRRITFRRKLNKIPKIPKYEYEPPPQYLLPSELRKLSKKQRKAYLNTIALTQNGIEVYRKPYRCVRQCVHPETGTLRFQEYVCYPPPRCDFFEFHPPVGRPVNCTCTECNEFCQPGCGCVKDCQIVRNLRAKVKHLQSPCNLEPTTICIPIPPRKPPDRICNKCALELQVDEEFNILNHVAVRKYIHQEDILYQKQKKQFEADELHRVIKIGRLCPTLHVDPKLIPKKTFYKGRFRIKKGKDGEPIVYYSRKRRFARLRRLFSRKKVIRRHKRRKPRRPFKVCVKDSIRKIKKSSRKTALKAKLCRARMKEKCEKRIEDLKTFGDVLEGKDRTMDED